MTGTCVINGHTPEKKHELMDSDSYTWHIRSHRGLICVLFSVRKECMIYHYYLLTYLLTYSMEQSPSWKANRFPVSQEIPRILWNPKVHNRSHKCSPPVAILSRLDSAHTFTFYFLKIHLNIILSSPPLSPKWSPSFGFSHQNPVMYHY